MHDEPQRDEARSLTRNTFLRAGAAGAMALGAGGVLAACGDDDDDGAGTGAGTGTGTASAPAEPKRGGNLRVAMTGGGSYDSLDPASELTYADFSRCANLYDPLTDFDRSGGTVENALAEEITPNEAGDEWTIRVKDGIEFHDGKTLSADDVIATFEWYVNSDSSGPRFAWVKDATLKKMDERTVRMTLKAPRATIPYDVAGYPVGVVPQGFDPKKPVGTGPFKFESFAPGEQSTMLRHENYWREVYLDQLEIINFADSSAEINALNAGQVEAIDAVPYTVMDQLESSGLKILNSESGAWRPFTMRVDVKPFSDVRVRQALRLVIDRPAMIEAAYAGHGKLGNDLFAPYDPAYNKDIPQREQDLEQAKSLLQEAGVSEVTLSTSPIATGVEEASQVLVEQARGAGLTVKLEKIPGANFYGERYLTYAFAVDFWAGRPYLYQVDQIRRTNETHWADGRDGMSAEEQEWLRLTDEAIRTLDDAKRTDLIHQAQQIEHDHGGYIIFGFPNIVNAYSDKVTGFEAANDGSNFNGYRFRLVSFT